MALPDCGFLTFLLCDLYDKNNFPVVELSDDSKKVRCNICEALHGHNGRWIQKESLAYHLKSDTHACSIIAQQNRELIRMAPMYDASNPHYYIDELACSKNGNYITLVQ